MISAALYRVLQPSWLRCAELRLPDGAVYLPKLAFCTIASCPDPSGDLQHLVSCGDCGASGHQTCLLFSDKLFEKVQSYPWQCIECKTCAVCQNPGDDDRLMLCDDCDRGYHIYCVKPPLDAVPAESWTCEWCQKGLKGPPVTRKPTPSSLKLKIRPPKVAKSTPQLSVRLPRQQQKRPSNDDIVSAVVSPKKRSTSADGNEFFADVCKKAYLQDPPTHLLAPLEVDHERCEPQPADIALFKNATTLGGLQPDGDEEQIETVHIGSVTMNAWHQAPYGEAYRRQHLYICEYCLKPLTGDFSLERHMSKCQWRHPPGDEIYRKGRLSVFEVDGKKSTLYCQDLCLLAKLFLDHKTLLYDVEPFMFYILTEYTGDGYHFVGYFSKEKRSMTQNVCCIVILPAHQKKGYGQWLIDFSYLLSRKEGKAGSPERPLSSHGLRSYQRYWRNTVCTQLAQFQFAQKQICFSDLCDTTGMTAADMEHTLEQLGFLTKRKGTYHIEVDMAKVDDIVRETAAQLVPMVDPVCLRWTPFHA